MKSFKKIQHEKRALLEKLSKEYQENIDLVIKMNKEDCERGFIDEERQKTKLEAYGKAQDVAWKYPKVVMG